jgi:hypothetical protein
MIDRRAQMLGQVFIFIIAGLVFVLIIGYGFRAITNFLERGEEVQLLDFRNELDASIKTIKRDYGSVQRVDLRVPTRTERVCFVSTETGDLTATQASQFKAELPLMYSAWSTGSENVFLVPKQPTPVLVQDLIVEDAMGYLCIAVVDDRIALRLEGTGNKARIRQWES